MARALLPVESEALEKSGSVLRFAAEHTKDLPQTVVSNICAAWDAQPANTWDQQIATEFWLAFNSLCDLIKPVTVDTLSTNVTELPAPRWKFWVREPVRRSLSRRSAARYLYLLMFLLCVSVLLGFVVATAASLNSQIQKLMDDGDQLTKKMVSEIDSLEPAIREKKFPEIEAAHEQEVALLQGQLADQDQLLEQMLQKGDVIARVISVGFWGRPYQHGRFQPGNDILDFRDAIRNYYSVRRDIGSDLLRISTITGMISSSVLPIVLGIMGACAYVIRLISDEIKNTTFSETSPIRHLVRVALGGLAGVVIGFGGLVSAGSLSSSAVAFIAGYAVEPVFATFDSIAEKFRR
jgi:hypothetical protein